MKFFLTSAGVTNTKIGTALVALLGKPISECSALCVPTAAYALPGGAAIAWKQICGEYAASLFGLGWKTLGVLELTALPSLKRERWISAVEETDALLVNGGDPLYLSYWLRKSGLADLLPTLRSDMVYVGLSAGSMVVGPTFGGENYGGIDLAIADDSGLGLVDFAMFPHLDHEKFPENSLANAELWAAKLPVPTYAIDDQTAIRVSDGTVEVISDGHWKLFSH